MNKRIKYNYSANHTRATTVSVSRSRSHSRGNTTPTRAVRLFHSHLLSVAFIIICSPSLLDSLILAIYSLSSTILYFLDSGNLTVLRCITTVFIYLLFFILFYPSFTFFVCFFCLLSLPASSPVVPPAPPSIIPVIHCRHILNPLCLLQYRHTQIQGYRLIYCHFISQQYQRFGFDFPLYRHHYHYLSVPGITTLNYYQPGSTIILRISIISSAYHYHNNYQSYKPSVINKSVT